METLTCTPQPDTHAPSPVEALRQAKMAQALALMIHEGYTQKAACEAVGLDPKMFRELARSSEALALLRRATEDALLDGLVAASAGYAKYIERLVGILNDDEAYARDVIAAGKELQAILV